MILYSFEALVDKTNENPEKIYDFFKRVTTKRLNKNVNSILNSTRSKDSYLLNNQLFVINPLHGSYTELYQYIYLSSKRYLSDYVYNKILWIPIELCDIDVTNNRLLTLTTDKIYFKYEEQYVSSNRKMQVGKINGAL